jgi:UPF0042 nucleotide-binding protein
VIKQDCAENLYKTINEVINVSTPGYVRVGKKYVTVAIGCTGGKHRSVTIAEKVAQELKNNGAKVRVVHRDLGKE